MATRLRRCKRKLVFVTFLIIIIVFAGFMMHKETSFGVENDIRDKSGQRGEGFSSSGALNVEIWKDICGHKMQSLKHFPLFPHRPSTRLRTSALQLYFRQELENSGLRIFGYLSPIESGDYSFHLDTSETSELWISSDSRPENSKLIANSTFGVAWKFDGRGSLVSLLAGKLYYLEVLLKHGKFERKFCHFEVKWKSSSWRVDDIREIPSNVFIARDTFEEARTFDHNKNLVLPMHNKRQDPSFATEESQRRAEMYHLPFIIDSDSTDLFPACDYNPSYLVKGPLERYQSTWELHFSSIYPFDYGDILWKEREDFLSFGNDILDENVAKAVVSQVWTQIENKHPR